MGGFIPRIIPRLGYWLGSIPSAATKFCKKKVVVFLAVFMRSKLIRMSGGPLIRRQLVRFQPGALLSFRVRERGRMERQQSFKLHGESSILSAPTIFCATISHALRHYGSDLSDMRRQV